MVVHGVKHPSACTLSKFAVARDNRILSGGQRMWKPDGLQSLFTLFPARLSSANPVPVVIRPLVVKT